jgi:methionyl-tRNA formyltransferase
MGNLLFSKRREDPYFEQAKAFFLANFPDTEVVLGLPGEPFPEEYLDWEGDYIVSYLCPWLIPGKLLKQAKKAAINFHPGPPEYPGTGCTNFAIYNQEKVYGVTCHHMAPVIDSGNIIAVKRFPLFPTDTVFSVTQRCYSYMLSLFYEVISDMISEKTFPVADETWKRDAYRLKDLNALKRITLDMSSEEIKRRIHATSYPGYDGAFIEIAGEIFVHKGS